MVATITNIQPFLDKKYADKVYIRVQPYIAVCEGCWEQLPQESQKMYHPGKMLYGQVMDCASCGRQLLGAVDPEVKPAVQMPGLCAGRIEIRGRR